MNTASAQAPSGAKSSGQLNQLEQLRKFTRIVADTGDFAQLKQYAPEDATTNPSLILKAAQKPEYQAIVTRVIADGKKAGQSQDEVSRSLLVAFGLEILKIVPHRVSTETSPKMSFDTKAVIDEAHWFIDAYAKAGIGRERVLIKIASTWEGIQAAKVLQKEGINCNMTLLFSLAQAIGAAEAGARLISPFVGRILDWYKKSAGKDFAPVDDPGVQSVREIYAYYKKFGYNTEVMGASFRSVGEVLELAGCDLLTISPELLHGLMEGTGTVERKLSPEMAKESKLSKINLDEKTFRWMLNESAMGTEKLSEGIRIFAADAAKMADYIAKHA